jgi:hypothetical protein
MIQAGVLIGLLGKVADDSSVGDALAELGASRQSPPLKDGVSADMEVPTSSSSSGTSTF